MASFTYQPHPRIAERSTERPVRVADQHKVHGSYSRFNKWLAIKITTGVGSMTCAYIFALLALVSLPDALRAGRPAIISWIAQTFLQLVLLSIIIVGQAVQAVAADKRSESTFNDAEAVLHTSLQIQAHLIEQDAEINRIVTGLFGNHK